MSLLTTLLESSGSSTNNLLDFRGSYDASVNTFPATGGSGASSTILKGDFWLASVGGTLGGSVVSVGDTIFATVDTPGQTASNWAVLEGNIGYTPENVANKNTNGGYVGRDANANATVNNTIAGFAATATSAGTLTLTNASGYIQVLTGGSAHTVVLPVATTMTAGQGFYILFKGTGTSTVTVQTSGGNSIAVISTTGFSYITCVDPNGGTGTASWTVLTGGSTSISGNVVVRSVSGDITVRDVGARSVTASTSMTSVAYIAGYSTTATAAGTTTLAVASNQQQYFTGTSTQTVVLPVTSTLVLGQRFEIYNSSTGLVTVQSSGANTIRILEPGSSVVVTCILTSGTGVASWSAGHASAAGGALYTNNQTGTTYSFALTDGGATVTASNAAASTYTLPQTSNVAFPIGTRIKLVNLGAGAVTLVKEGAETLIGNTLLAQYATVMIEKTSATQWQVFGGTAVVVEQTTVAIVATLVNDKVYDIAVPNFGGTITGLTLRNTSVGTAGTYTAKINSTNITGLAAIANSATRTLTAATAANTFVSGDVISYTPTGTTSVVDAFITLYYTRQY